MQSERIISATFKGKWTKPTIEHSRCKQWIKERHGVKVEVGGYQEEHLVWLFDHRGFALKQQRFWNEPYVVVKRVNYVKYRIRRKPIGKPRLIHLNCIVPFLGDKNDERNVRACKVSEKESKVEDLQPKMMRAIRFFTVSQERSDLYKTPAQYALAHCAAQALTTKGISQVFRRRFGTVGNRLQLEYNGQQLFYMVSNEFLVKAQL